MSAFSLIAGYLPIFQPEPVSADTPDEPWTRVLAPGRQARSTENPT